MFYMENANVIEILSWGSFEIKGRRNIKFAFMTTIFMLIKNILSP
jgi:hypothetical protein